MFDKNSQGGQSQQFAAGTSPSHSALEHPEIPSKQDVPGLALLPRQSSTNPSPPLAERIPEHFCGSTALIPASQTSDGASNYTLLLSLSCQSPLHPSNIRLPEDQSASST